MTIDQLIIESILHRVCHEDATITDGAAAAILAVVFVPAKFRAPLAAEKVRERRRATDGLYGCHPTYGYLHPEEREKILFL